jgi:hypothetical protein
LSRKKIIGLIILLVIAGGAYYGYKQYNRQNKDYQNVQPDFILPANGLIGEYETNDSAAAQKYNGRDVEVSGVVKNIEKDEKGFYTIILGESTSLSSVRCSMDTTHQQDAAQLSKGSSATMRGLCTGFNKDEMGLGSDVILNRCVIITKKD